MNLIKKQHYNTISVNSIGYYWERTCVSKNVMGYARNQSLDCQVYELVEGNNR